MRHTADYVVLANGVDPVVPAVPGLRDLDGVWSNREATSMKAIPRRLLILGGGPVGVEMAQAVRRRLGGEAAVIDMAEHVLGWEPAPLGEGLGARFCAVRASSPMKKHNKRVVRKWDVRLVPQKTRSDKKR